MILVTIDGVNDELGSAGGPIGDELLPGIETRGIPGRSVVNEEIAEEICSCSWMARLPNDLPNNSPISRQFNSPIHKGEQNPRQPTDDPRQSEEHFGQSEYNPVQSEEDPW